ncbi:MAG: acyl-CoA reductase [Bacteroidota bacterium]|nr:acyl-CoA reductase [Bacteroidota bacterium]
MTELKNRIKALENLGNYFSNISDKDSQYDALFDAIERANLQNGWFQREACVEAIQSWGATLQSKNISQWINQYQINENNSPKTIAVIMAGNIPLVGLHDLISIWISGNRALVKCATKDSVLIPFIVEINPLFQSLTSFTDGKLEGFDAVIATGSNNAARYFDYYFSKYPHIIRKNRNGVAVLDGSETQEDMKNLGRDILQYYGLGCRNVSKLYLSKGFDLDLIFKGLYPYANIIKMNKYANNYDYYKAVYLISQFDFKENGFFILRENQAISSPIGTGNYEFYEGLDLLKKHLLDQQENIQCIISNADIEGAIPFGQAQNPNLWDYADGVDTLEFLNRL